MNVEKSAERAPPMHEALKYGVRNSKVVSRDACVRQKADSSFCVAVRKDSGGLFGVLLVSTFMSRTRRCRARCALHANVIDCLRWV